MSKQFKSSLIFITIVLLAKEYNARELKFNGASVNFSPKFFTNFTISTKDNAIYVDMHIIQPLKAGFRANVEFQTRLSNSKEYQKLFSYTLDVCNVIISLKESVFKKWYSDILKYGNFMENCPVSNGHYYLNGWKLDKTLVPVILQNGDYRLKGYLFNGKYKTKSENFIADLTISAVIEETPN